MILIDTSIWIDHLHRADPRLGSLLSRGSALLHPLVLGELVCGRFASRTRVLALLRLLPPAPRATDGEALDLIERRTLYGRGLGFVDAHLLAACLIGGVGLWTRDRALFSAAGLLGLASDPGDLAD